MYIRDSEPGGLWWLRFFQYDKLYSYLFQHLPLISAMCLCCIYSVFGLSIYAELFLHHVATAAAAPVDVI